MSLVQPKLLVAVEAEKLGYSRSRVLFYVAGSEQE